MNDYIYDIEAEQYSFLRMPKILLQHEAYQGLSLDARLLYSKFWNIQYILTSAVCGV